MVDSAEGRSGVLTLAGETRALQRLVMRCRRDARAEDVHELRSTARRIEVYLRLAKWRVLRADLRRLSRALGPLRDCDVASEAKLGASFEAWLSARRQAEVVRVRRALKAPRVDALLAALERLPSLETNVAQHVSRKLTRRAKDTVRPTFESLHDSRRAIRRAHLATQWVGDDASRLKKRQRLMGVVSDLSCLARMLREFGDEGAASVCDRGVERLLVCFASARR